MKYLWDGCTELWPLSGLYYRIWGLSSAEVISSGLKSAYIFGGASKSGLAWGLKSANMALPPKNQELRSRLKSRFRLGSCKIPATHSLFNEDDDDAAPETLLSPALPKGFFLLLILFNEKMTIKVFFKYTANYREVMHTPLFDLCQIMEMGTTNLMIKQLLAVINSTELLHKCPYQVSTVSKMLVKLQIILFSVHSAARFCASGRHSDVNHRIWRLHVPL